MKHIGLFGIIFLFASCNNQSSFPDTNTKEIVTTQPQPIEIEIEQPAEPTRKYDFQPGPDPELEYYAEHFDDYFNDPEDLLEYPDEIFDFNLD